MALLRADQDALFALVGEASESLNLRQSWVEKDFWITELLRSVSKETEDIYVVFKGGTSLSKVLGLTRRFSNDVDVLVVVTTETSKNFGKGSIDKRLKEITARASEDLASEAVPADRPTTGVKRYSTFSYPSRVPTDEIIRNVRLEMGTRGGDVPASEFRPVRSYVTDYLERENPDVLDEYEELKPFEMRVLAPERTLVEKLSLLNALAVAFPDSAPDLGRASRHVYDVAALLLSDEISSALEANPKLISILAPDVEEISSKDFDNVSPRPEAGFGSSPVFDPSTDVCLALREAYESDLPPLVYGDLRPFDECLEIVGSRADLL